MFSKDMNNKCLQARVLKHSCMTILLFFCFVFIMTIGLRTWITLVMQLGVIGLI